MSKKKSVLLTLLVLGGLYFALLWFPNATGARDLNMTFLFSSDEPAQYPYMLRMLSPGKTLLQSVYRFIAYQQYVYGFPYYFYGAVFGLLPVKLLAGSASVSLHMVLLRQIVCVLPMIAAIIILVYLQTGFESRLKSVLLFLLLLLVPEVVQNDMRLHPESLVFLFIVLTFFFLARDNLNFGKSFYLAALFCGLAVSTKLIGLFFFLSIPLYIFLGRRQKQIDSRKSVIMAATFIAIMLITFVVSNPFLFWESQRVFALKIQTKMHNAMAAGFVVTYHNSPWAWLDVISTQFAVPAFLLLCVTALIIGSIRGEKRLLNRLIAAWAIPFMLYLSAAIVIRPPHFPLPILLPVFSALPAYFTLAIPQRFTHPLGDYLKRNGYRLLLLSLGTVAVGSQLIFSSSNDISNYWSTLHRESNNPSLKFYAGLDKDRLSHVGLDRRLIVFRDVAMYIPNSKEYDVHFKWGVSGYGDIQKINPDLLVLSKQHLHDYTQPAQLETALDPNFAQAYRFYTDVLTENVAGYTMLYQDEFGIAYIRNQLYEQYFSSP